MSATLIKYKLEGETDKLVRMLSQRVVVEAPSILMMDECDTLSNDAAGSFSSAEAIKGEILDQWGYTHPPRRGSPFSHCH